MRITIQRDYARTMRQSMTMAERKMWNAIKNRKLAGFRFNRQVEIGAYIADFVCREKKLIVEIDGPSHSEDDAAKSDQIRTACLQRQGYSIFRTWNFEVYENLDGVLQRLLGQLEAKK